jgi:hypothetical protein
MNSIRPAGVEEPAALSETAAVNETFWPASTGLSDAETKTSVVLPLKPFINLVSLFLGGGFVVGCAGSFAHLGVVGVDEYQAVGLDDRR